MYYSHCLSAKYFTFKLCPGKIPAHSPTPFVPDRHRWEEAQGPLAQASQGQSAPLLAAGCWLLLLWHTLSLLRLRLCMGLLFGGAFVSAAAVPVLCGFGVRGVIACGQILEKL